MIKQCPSCKSFNVRHSSLYGAEVSAHHILLSPYRGRDCRLRFWIINKSGYYLAGIISVAIMVVVIGRNMGEGPNDRAGDAKWSTVAAKGFEDRTALTDESSADLVTLAAGRFADTAKLAHNNDPVAEYQLAQMYLKGEGAPVNEEEARIWLERAADHGNAEAQFAFSIVLREGHGVVQDFERAAKLTRMAAESGHSVAQFALGLMYRNGIGIPADTVKAYTWLNLAASRGVKGAAQARDQVLRILSAQEVLAGQAEARRLSESLPKLVITAD